MGPYGPIWALMGPYGPEKSKRIRKKIGLLIKKSLILIKHNKMINKNIEVVKLEILKVKTWFGDKDLSS